MSLTKTSYSMINGAPANVLDFGAKGDGINDDTAAIQAALNASGIVYLPKGVYAISSAITLPGDVVLYGEGPLQVSIKATTASATLQNTSSHYWIQLSGFTFDGNNVATTGISLGIPNGGAGTSAFDTFQNVNVTNCTGDGLVLNALQYSLIFNCVISNCLGHGIRANEILTTTFSDISIFGCVYGILLDYANSNDSSQVYLNRIDFTDPVSNGQWFLVINGGYEIVINECTFENTTVLSNPPVIINNTNTNLITGNIFFTDCTWLGLPHAQTLILIYQATRIFFTRCRAIRPSSGYYILNNSSGTNVVLNDCFAGNGYTDFPTYYWTDGGFTTGTVIENRSVSSLLQTDYINNKLLLPNGSYVGTGAALWTSGSGSPNGSVTAPVGSLYTNVSGGSGTTLYVKESGSGNTGWVAK